MELVSRAQAPPWTTTMLAHHGYRQEMSARDCLRSVFHLHNQTVNIWSPLIGGVYFLGLLCADFNEFYSAPGHAAHEVTPLVFKVYYIAGLLAMVASTTFHTFLNTTGTYDRMLRYDISGAFLLVFTSNATASFYILDKHPAFQVMHLCGLCVATACTLSVLFSRVDGSEDKEAMIRGSWPAVVLGSITTSYWLCAVAQVALLEGQAAAWAHISVWGAEYLVSMANPILFFLFKVPECFFPGHFDFVGCSHNWFHIFVVVTCIMHLQNMHAMHILQVHASSGLIDA